MRLVRGSEVCELLLEGVLVRIDGELTRFASAEAARAAFGDAVAERRDDGFVEAPDVVDDVEARLVYADELQLRGDPLGELIAVQHSLATARDMLPAQRRKLERRVRGLLDEHHDTMFGPLATHVQRPSNPTLAMPALEVTWRLGFPDEIRLRSTPKLDLHELYGELRKLSIARLVTRLVIGEQTLPSPWIEQGSYVKLGQTMAADGVPPHLRSLLLGDVPPTHRNAINAGDLRPVVEASMLQELEVRCGSGMVGPLVSPTLRRLVIEHMWDGGLRELPHSTLPALTELSVSRTRAPELLRELIRSDLLEQLSSLALRRCFLDDTELGAILDNAPKFERLERLDLRGNQFSMSRVASARRRLPRLKA